jgi:hypothetical protein
LKLNHDYKVSGHCTKSLKYHSSALNKVAHYHIRVILPQKAVGSLIAARPSRKIYSYDVEFAEKTFQTENIHITNNLTF